MNEFEFERIKETGEFAYVYKSGVAWHTPSLVLFYKASESFKVGFVASKKVGGAVQRNRAKRRLRALFREFKKSLKSGLYIFVAKVRIVDAPYEEIRQEFCTALRKVGALKSA